MNPKDAIKYFKTRIKLGQCGKGTTQREAMEMAIEALEKQTPKKPYGTNGDWAKLSMNRCPYCKAYPLSPNDNYCSNCGQAIDWEGIE